MKKFKHVIMICFDTLRADCIGATPRAGEFSHKYRTNFKLQTGELDKILSKGIYYDNCIAAASSTSISHASYFTGLWPRHHGIYEYFNRKLKKPTIFEYAQGHGYKTIFQTDFPIILGNYLGFDKGIDEYFIEDEKSALNKLNENSAGKTLSFFHFGGIHYPYGFHVYKFGGEAFVEKIEELEKKYEIVKDDTPHDMHDESNRSAFDMQLLSRYKAILQKMYRQGLYNEIFNLYLEGINFFFKTRGDNFLKSIREFADKNDALLVIFADHGEEWSENSFGHYNSLSDEVLRVPLILYGKGLKKSIVDDLVRTIDVAPTLFHFMDFDEKNEKMKFDGELLPLQTGDDSNVNRYALAQFWYHGNKEKFIKHQEKVFQQKKLIKPMNTKLMAEVVYGGGMRVHKTYNKDGEVASKIVEKEKAGRYIKANESAMSRELEAFLSKYNQDTITRGKQVSAGKDIKKYLRNLGYNI